MNCDICCEDMETTACKNESCDWHMCDGCVKVSTPAASYPDFH